ncbi:MAG: type II toxin-antitoxin system RelE/ParE family toxin [archaeon]
MSYRILLHLKAARFLQKAGPSVRDQLKRRLRELEELSETKGEHLKHSPFYSLRVGDYRAIYEIDSERRMVIVLFIGHRRDVYDDFSRLLD